MIVRWVFFQFWRSEVFANVGSTVVRLMFCLENTDFASSSINETCFVDWSLSLSITSWQVAILLLREVKLHTRRSFTSIILGLMAFNELLRELRSTLSGAVWSNTFPARFTVIQVQSTGGELITESRKERIEFMRWRQLTWRVRWGKEQNNHNNGQTRICNFRHKICVEIGKVNKCELLDKLANVGENFFTYYCQWNTQSQHKLRVRKVKCNIWPRPIDHPIGELYSCSNELL